jgi:hypothetical protein
MFVGRLCLVGLLEFQESLLHLHVQVHSLVSLVLKLLKVCRGVGWTVRIRGDKVGFLMRMSHLLLWFRFMTCSRIVIWESFFAAELLTVEVVIDLYGFQFNIRWVIEMVEIRGIVIIGISVFYVSRLFYGLFSSRSFTRTTLCQITHLTIVTSPTNWAFVSSNSEWSLGVLAISSFSYRV